VGASVWIEANGDVLLYLARPDSFSEISRLLHIGKIRIALDPAPRWAGASFRQELKLRQGRLEADLGTTHIEVFADPGRPVLRVTVRSAAPLAVRVADEGWRRERHLIGGDEMNSAWTMQGAPKTVEVAESADVPLGTDQAPNAMAWYHHNQESVVPFVLKHQSCDGLPGAFDPLTWRTFGAWIEGEHLVREGARALVSDAPATAFDIRIACPSLVDQRVDAWIELARRTARDAPSAAQARAECEQWWNGFWNRSWVLVSDATPGIARVSAGYNLSRYAFACQGRGEFPIKFNGGIFTVEPGFIKTKKNTEGLNPDYRRWGDCYWYQNTRHMYHPMLPAGDTDLMAPFYALYRNVRQLSEARTKRWYGVEGAFFPETMTIFGSYAVGDYGWDRSASKPGDVQGPWWRYAWNQGPELVSLMLDHWEWTADQSFAAQDLVPMAASVLRYFDSRFRKDGKGHIVLDPCQVIEIYRNATNDQPTIAGLRAIAPRLLALPANLVSEADRALYSRIRDACPDLPIEERELDGKRVRVLAPAERYEPKRSNGENPGIYPVWPYRLFGVGKPDLELARNTYLTREKKLYTGWGYDGNVAALLGMTDEAAKILLIQCANSNPAYRFPATWGPNADWLPDQNHSGNLMNTAQLMLLQYDGAKIQLLPAWPPTWNVDFKLHAPARTVIEGSVANGKLIRLNVIPETRRADVEVCAPFAMP